MHSQNLGLTLRSPLVAGASPMGDSLDVVRQLEDAGVGAIVLRSVFEEQIEAEVEQTFRAHELSGDLSAEATALLPHPDAYVMAPERYLEHLFRVKQAVSVPVMGSLNGTTASGWLRYARGMEQAGADAIELNVYHVASDPDESGRSVEQRTLDIVAAVKAEVSVPISVKLSPFYSSLGNFARALDQAGVDGLVLFNRFYQPDIDPEALEVVPRLHLSDPTELPLRLRWLAILSPVLRPTLACSGGVHSVRDVISALMAGASTVQLASALLLQGPDLIARLDAELVEWLDLHNYQSVTELVGCMNLNRCPDPSAFERAQYMRILSSWPR